MAEGLTSGLIGTVIKKSFYLQQECSLKSVFELQRPPRKHDVFLAGIQPQQGQTPLSTTFYPREARSAAPNNNWVATCVHQNSGADVNN